MRAHSEPREVHRARRCAKERAIETGLEARHATAARACIECCHTCQRKTIRAGESNHRRRARRRPRRRAGDRRLRCRRIHRPSHTRRRRVHIPRRIFCAHAERMRAIAKAREARRACRRSVARAVQTRLKTRHRHVIRARKSNRSRPAIHETRWRAGDRRVRRSRVQHRQPERPCSGESPILIRQRNRDRLRSHRRVAVRLTATRHAAKRLRRPIAPRDAIARHRIHTGVRDRPEIQRISHPRARRRIPRQRDRWRDIVHGERERHLRARAIRGIRRRDRHRRRPSRAIRPRRAPAPRAGRRVFHHVVSGIINDVEAAALIHKSDAVRETQQARARAGAKLI